MKKLILLKAVSGNGYAQKLLIAALVFCLQVLSVSAQATTGKIVGTVSAPDGAIPGATIVVTDTQTGKERVVTANGDGNFEVPLLEFGTYTVKITAAGFKVFTATNVKVDAGREYPLNALLQVGEVSQQVTVTAEGTEQINSSNAELSTTVSQQQIRDLPLDGRNPLSLAYLQAGSSVTTNSINGQRASSTTITRDGLNIQDNFIRTGSIGSSAFGDSPSVDDVSEFTLTTQNAGVEQGGGSSQVQLVTPRGGANFHGALYAFNRNSLFTANEFFNNQQGIDKPFLNRNQFGGSISGPAPLPNFGEGGPVFLKNKAFFFFNYEGFRLAQQDTVSTVSDSTGTLQPIVTLLPQARNGDFTYINSAGQLTTVNVLNGSNFTSGILAEQGGILGVDPIIQARYLSGLPNTANGLTTGINLTQRVNLLRSSPIISNSWTGRFDFDFNDRNSFSAVYKRKNSQSARTDLPAGFSNDAFVSSGGPTNFLALAYRKTVGSNFTNEVRGGFQYSEPFFTGSHLPTDFIIAQPSGALGITNPEGTRTSDGRNTLYRNFQDNAVYTLGNHSLRFGGEAEYFKIESVNFSGTIPTYTISSSTNPNTPPLTAQQICGSVNCINTTDLNRANNLRYFLGGVIGSSSRQANLISPEEGYGFGPSIKTLNFEIYSGYVSDQWRARPNLTLNFGLRYEFYTPLNSKQGNYLEPVVQGGDLKASILDPNGALDLVGGNAGKKGDFNKPDRNNFAPSVSFAYTPRFEKGLFSNLLGGGTVLRGGFRINYVNDEYVKSTSTLVGANPGVGSVITSETNLASALTPRGGFTAVPTVSDLPTFGNPRVSFLQNNINQGGAQVFGIDPNVQVPRTYEYNFGIQRNIGFKTVAEIRYVGGFSNDLIRTTDFNQIDIRNNGFLTDFLRAQNNLALNDTERARRINLLVAGGQTVAQATAAVNAQLPRSAAFNSTIAGSVALPVFSQLAGGGATILANGTNIGLITQNRVGSLAQNLILLGQRGNVVFQQNPNIFISEILQNAGKYRYNALQAEVRRRFSDGLSFQANYTFSKTLTDIPDDSQNRQGELQDINNPRLNYSRPDYDRTHVFNANLIYELPFGKGKRFLNKGGLTNLIFGGFQFGSIISISSGPPLGIIDPRSTSAITFEASRQSATSSLTTSRIKDLTGIFKTPNGIYFIDPKVLNATIVNQTTGESRTGFDLFQTLPAGFVLSSVRAASPVGSAPFPGQVFFFNNAGSTGNLPRNFINGLPYANWDASLSKNFRFSESTRLQLRVEAFNVLNRQSLAYSADLDVNSNSFGRVTETNTISNPSSPRVLQFGARFDF